MGLFGLYFWREARWEKILLTHGQWPWTFHKAYMIFFVILETTYPQEQTKTAETIKQMIPAPPTIRISILCDWLPISTSFTTLLLDFVFMSPMTSFTEFFKSPILFVSCFPAFFSFISLLVVVPILSLVSSSFTLLLLLLFFLLSLLLRIVFFFVVSFLVDEFTLYLHKNGNFLWHQVSWTDLPDILAQSSMCPNCNQKTNHYDALKYGNEKQRISTNELHPCRSSLPRNERKSRLSSHVHGHC